MFALWLREQKILVASDGPWEGESFYWNYFKLTISKCDTFD